MDKRYFAFISYKREDLKQAEWLRNKLSHYHFPSKLRKENEALPKAIRPLFRDSLELAGGFLAKEIETALSESKYLIVICSPRSAKSPWVNKEVEYFIEHGREEYIIPYIIDGEPFSNDPEKECFPPALKSLQGEKELLGISTSELSKEAAAVKVVARMFGLRFDTLWQGYNREQRRKRLLWSAAAIFLILVSVAVSGWFCYANSKIEAMNKEITEQNNEILNKNSEILRKNDMLLVSQSRYLASVAMEEYENGNKSKAIRLALYALPKNLDNPDRPYTVKAEAALRICNNKVYDNAARRVVIHHKNEINHLAFTPDSKYLITTSRDNTIRVCDAVTGRPVTGPLKYNGFYGVADISPDGRNIAAVYGDTLYIWDLRSDEPVNKFKLDYYVSSLVYSPDGEMMALTYIPEINSSARQYNVVVLNARTAKVMYGPFKFDSTVNHTAFSPDGKNLLVADGSEVCVYNLNSGENVFWQWHSRNVDFAEFSQDGNRIISSAINGDVSVWDFKKGCKVFETLEHPDWVDAALFSPDGNQFLTAFWDDSTRRGTLHVRDTETGKLVFDPILHAANITSGVYSPDGNYIATASWDKTARVWNAKNGKFVADMKHGNKVTSVVFSPDCKSIATSTEDNTVYIWDFNDTSIKSFDDFLELFINGCYPKGDYLLRHDACITSLAVSQDGKYLVTTSEDCTARVWDAETMQQTADPMVHDMKVYSARFSPDGKYVVTASADNTARVWNARTGKPFAIPMRHADNVYSAVFSPDGKYIATASADGTACVWDARNGKSVTPFLKHKDEVNSVQFTPDGKYLITASADKTARVWDVNTGKPVTGALAHDDEVNSVSVSPDGKYAVTASKDKSARVWDITSGDVVTRPLLHDGNVTSAQFSPDGKYIVTASADNTARVWDTVKGTPVTAPMWHDAVVSSAVFSPDGKYIATVSNIGNTNIWDAKSGELLIVPLEQGSSLLSFFEDKISNSVVFSPDGKKIFPVCNFNDVYIYKFPPLQELIDKYRKDPEHDWSLSQEEKDEYSLE